MLLPGLSDEEFVIHLYEVVLGRFPAAAEIRILTDALRASTVSREQLLLERFSLSVEELREWERVGITHDTSRFYVMGTSRVVTFDDWRARRRGSGPGAPAVTHARFPAAPRSCKVDVSVICSLWRGGKFIERYMNNITSQTIFGDRCEVIIVDAASPENEGAVVERFRQRFGNRVVYHRLPYRAGIYAAWNVGVGLARGKYLTNANLDDLRRQDSLAIQAGVLDALPHIDVVYQDFLYSAEPDATLEEIVRVGVNSELPLVTPHTMFVSNPPHNAPMWRASIHHDVGLFDEAYRSAGDYDFWLRALAAGKQFYKTNDPHVVYYFNPDGLSTARNTRGIVEPRQALRRNGRAIMPKAAIEPPSAFLARLGMSQWPVDTAHRPLSRYAVVQHRMRDLCREMRT